MKRLPLPKFWGYYEGRYVKNNRGNPKAKMDFYHKGDSQNTPECRGTSNVVRSLKAMVIRVTERVTHSDGTTSLHIHQVHISTFYTFYTQTRTVVKRSIGSSYYIHGMCRSPCTAIVAQRVTCILPMRMPHKRSSLGVRSHVCA